MNSSSEADEKFELIRQEERERIARTADQAYTDKSEPTVEELEVAMLNSPHHPRAGAFLDRERQDQPILYAIRRAMSKRKIYDHRLASLLAEHVATAIRGGKEYEAAVAYESEE